MEDKSDEILELARLMDAAASRKSGRHYVDDEDEILDWWPKDAGRAWMNWKDNKWLKQTDTGDAEDGLGTDRFRSSSEAQ